MHSFKRKISNGVKQLNNAAKFVSEDKISVSGYRI